MTNEEILAQPNHLERRALMALKWHKGSWRSFAFGAQRSLEVQLPSCGSGHRQSFMHSLDDSRISTKLPTADIAALRGLNLGVLGHHQTFMVWRSYSPCLGVGVS